MNSIDILFENIKEAYWFDKAKIFIFKVLELLEIDNWEFSVTFCNNDFIQKLNREFRKKDSPTDVLTFAQDDELFPGEDHANLHNSGDIIISLDTLKENAEYFDVAEEEELKRLLIHGVLHLNGMDHSDNSPEQEMLKLQEELLLQLAEVKIY